MYSHSHRQHRQSELVESFGPFLFTKDLLELDTELHSHEGLLKGKGHLVTRCADFVGIGGSGNLTGQDMQSLDTLGSGRSILLPMRITIVQANDSQGHFLCG